MELDTYDVQRGLSEMDSMETINTIRPLSVKMEEVLTDSGIASCDSDTYVGSDIFSDYSQTSTLKEEIMVLKQ